MIATAAKPEDNYETLPGTTQSQTDEAEHATPLSNGGGAQGGERQPGAVGGLDAEESKHNIDVDLPETKDPVRSKVTVKAGHFSMQGIRPEMEDKATVFEHPQFNEAINLRSSVARHFFAVYDGHGGDVAAEYCRQHVHINMAKHEDFLKRGELSEALAGALVKTDEDFCAACRRIHLVVSSGTTAICAYIVEDELVVANVGDSRGVLSRNGKAVPVSNDHKPGRPDEQDRIEALGGRVGRTEDEAWQRERKNGEATSGCCFLARTCLDGKRPLRVFPGGLSVSRTIGDISMKATQLIVSTPECFSTKLSAGDQFLILACDGVWDVMNNQQAVDCVRNHTDDVSAAARILAKEAYRRGSTDNISVVLVFFEYS